MKLIVIPDSHAHPDHPNERYNLLGSLIYAEKPDIVVDLGDSADMPSLCSYDKGKKAFEGRRYTEDCDSYKDAMERLWHPYTVNKKRKPKRYKLQGNHEQRINRVTSLSPELSNVLDPIRDLDEYRYWDEYVPYHGNTPGFLNISGIVFAHYFTSGVMGSPIGGVHLAYQILNKNLQSSIQGHSHILDFKRLTKADGSSILGLSAGCYVDYDCDYMGESQRFWWNGITILDDLQPNGTYDPNFVSYNKIKKVFG